MLRTGLDDDLPSGGLAGTGGNNVAHVHLLDVSRCEPWNNVSVDALRENYSREHTPERSMAAFSAMEPRRVAGIDASLPWKFPMGVRADETMTTSWQC